MSTNKKSSILWKIKKSKIQGKGMFTNVGFNKNERIGVGIGFNFFILPYVTSDFGSWINHSYKPNARLVYSTSDAVYHVVANKYLPKNTEITLDYRDTPWYIYGPGKDFK